MTIYTSAKVNCKSLIQKLLLLPELTDIAINTNNDLIETTSRTCSSNVMPTHKLVNNELINDECGLSSNEVASAKIIVDRLSASWTHVNNIVSYM